MKYCLVIFSFLLFGCIETIQKSKTIIGNDFPVHPKTPKNIVAIPDGAVIADYNGDGILSYGYVSDIDTHNEITSIGFEDEKYPTIIIPESIGAQLQLLKLKNFDRDLLLVNAKLKDTNFNEYYLFILRDSVWKQVVNRFDIHKSNMSDTLVPVQINPKDSTQLLRYYSVFDLDRANGKRYQWKLLHESVDIDN